MILATARRASVCAVCRAKERTHQNCALLERAAFAAAVAAAIAGAVPLHWLIFSSIVSESLYGISEYPYVRQLTHATKAQQISSSFEKVTIQ